MKLPAKIIYAYKAVLELALRYTSQSPVQIRVISKAQRIPEKFLVQILIRLKNAGIVASSRGIGGGYVLARNPSRITLADVFRAVDVHILSAEAPEADGAHTVPGLSALWSKVNKALTRELESVSFEQLIHQLNRQELTYTI